MLPNEPVEEERLEQLPQDNGTPFQPADATRIDSAEPDADEQVEATLSDTHPVTDTNVDSQELYDEGVSGAAEASEPNAGNTVTRYDEPDKTGSLS